MNARPRRRRRAPLAARVRRLWIVLALVVVAIACASYALVTAPWFRVERIDVAGAVVVPKSTILARAAIDRDANVWLLPTTRITERIRAIPLIARASLSRSLPNGVRLEVGERTASACVDTVQGSATIDDERRVLYGGCKEDLPRLRLARPRPLTLGTFLHDEGLAAMQRDIVRIERAGLHVASLRDDRYGGLDATLRDGLIVQFGSTDDLDAKAALVPPVLAAVSKQRARIAAIDIRAPGTPVLRYR